MHTQPKEAHLIFQGRGYLKTNILLMERKGKSYFLEWQNAISLNINFPRHKKIDFTENIENWQKGKKTNVECVLCRKV